MIAEGSTERGRRRRRAIIDAARNLFVAHGYRGTTLEAIIARAGGSRQTIYRDLGGKRGLISAIVSEASDKFADLPRERLELIRTPYEYLIDYGLRLAEIWRSEEARAINRVVISEGLDAPDLLDAWYRAGPERSIGALAGYLETQQRSGALKLHDPALVARQFMTLVMGELAYPMISGDPPLPVATQIQRCVELILNAYGQA